MKTLDILNEDRFQLMSEDEQINVSGGVAPLVVAALKGVGTVVVGFAIYKTADYICEKVTGKGVGKALADFVYYN